MAPQALPGLLGGVLLIGISLFLPGASRPIGLSLGAVISLGLAFLYRSPRRPLPTRREIVYAPADGRVVGVHRREPRREWEIVIFLSLLDVHLQRAPTAGKVLAVERTEGRFWPASSEQAGLENHRVSLRLSSPWGEIEVVQIAGILARRIVCYPRPGDWLPAGALYGLIHFGSRVYLYLPAGATPLVEPGARVQAGRSPVATFEPSPPQDSRTPDRPTA